MAIRVTEAEVREIIDVDASITSLTAFIIAANRVVEDHLVDSDCTISEETLKEIERWLAAHFTAVQDKRFTRERAGEADVSYEGKTEFFFKFTGYGQQAMLLDPCGILKKLDGGGRKVTLKTFTRDS